MTRILTLSALALGIAAPAFAGTADIVARHAAENGEYQTVQFIADGGYDGEYVSVSSKGSPSISALEVALRAAEENDDWARAAYLRSQIAN